MRRRVLPKRLPKQQSADAAEREYMRNLLNYSRTYSQLMHSGIMNLLHELKPDAVKELPEEFKTDSLSVPRFDANFEKSVRDLFASVQNRMKKMFPDSVLRKWAEAMTAHVNDISKKNTSRIASVVDLEVEPLMRDKELTPFFKNVVDENVGLIRSISQQKLPQFKNFLVNAITNDIHNKDFWKNIEKYVDQNTMSVRAHAKLIARDQVNKLNGKVAQYRQQQLGGERYIWRTSGDERVREEHKKLDGSIQRWDSPPVTDKRTGARNHPGGDYQCRCTAEMILEDVVD